MKRCLLALAIVLAAPLLGAAAQVEGATFYLQLIRGTDSDSPPTPDARPAGQALRRRLEMFRWKNYWEIKREIVFVQTGGKTRRRMSAKREVEIALPNAHEMTVCLYANGKLARRRTQPMEAAFYIAGGDTDTNASQSWFIVVRRDKPAAVAAN